VNNVFKEGVAVSDGQSESFIDTVESVTSRGAGATPFIDPYAQTSRARSTKMKVLDAAASLVHIYVTVPALAWDKASNNFLVDKEGDRKRNRHKNSRRSAHQIALKQGDPLKH